ncbi:MAG: AAA family ATPase [Gemmatimonadota bacterium]
MICFRTLGPVELTVDGAAAPAELLWRKNLALLVYLARSPARARTRDHLVGLLWGDKAESAARHSLNEAVRVIRKYTGDGGLESEAGQLRLAEGAVQMDTDQLEALVADEDWDGAAELVAGEFLEGFFVPGSSDFEDWLHGERTSWRRQCVEVLLKRGERLLSAGNVREAASSGERALALEPTSGAAVRLAMRSTALAGDRAGALAIYEALVAQLEEELGIGPDEETRALAERVRRERSWRLPERVEMGEEPGALSRRTPLIGRDAELGRLLEAWETTRLTRRASMGVIEGDPGTGKTRLAEEVVARARLDGATVGAVWAVEADMTEAWSGLLALGRSGLLDAPGIEAASPAALAAFASHVPELAQRFSAVTEGVAPMPLGRSFSEVLEIIAGDQPTLLLIDDAQWVDRDSLLALGAVLRDCADVPVLVLLAASSHPPREELDDLRAHIGRELAGVAVRLGLLPVDALRELARWALPSYNAVELDRVTRRLVTDSAGFPLLAVEILHAVALGLDVGAIHSAWPEPFRTLDQTLPSDLPDAVVAAIRVGFRRLSQSAQRVLAAAAVLVDRVDRPTLARATGLSEDELLAALDDLEWHRWIVAETRGYSFVARLARDVVARDMLTPGQRQRIEQAAKAV